MKTWQQIDATDLPAGDALDLIVAERVMGWRVVEYDTARGWPSPAHIRAVRWASPPQYAPVDDDGEDWSPSRHLVDAFDVVLRLRSRWCDLTIESSGDNWTLTIVGVASATDRNLHLAICRAALKAFAP